MTIVVVWTLIVLLAIFTVMHLLAIAWRMGKGLLAEEDQLMPGMTYFTLGALPIEDGHYTVLLRRKNSVEYRVYRMKYVPPDVFVVEVTQDENSALVHYKPVPRQDLDIKA